MSHTTILLQHERSCQHWLLLQRYCVSWVSLCAPIKKHLFELKHKEKSLGMNLKRVLVAAGEVKDGLCAPRGQTRGRSIFIKVRRDAGFMGSDDVGQASIQGGLQYLQRAIH